ncbi:retinoblastoma-like protein 1 [Orbicella faveolata]|uniref:retinoblastoma-like protein 1 n=1 Tax=Orbicella faveolata TaxID=48498 RepID=UPI0009E426B4|nr:retinoblastoma-like protein 1 [Orbicella faveolata]
MASSSDDEEANSSERFDNLCRDLNMDEETSQEAWSSYQKISTNYTLEGDSLHWLACALYVACRKSVVPTVDSSGTVEGNCVSLTRLLRAAKLSLIQFFSKMKKWLDMSNAAGDFRKKIELLERNFHVSTVIFKKYEPIFLEIFKDPREENTKTQRGRKSRKQPCSVGDVFAFCWTLYIQAKGHFPAISDDLVNSYHLLLCCLDLLYSNALFTRNRRELLNPNFEGLPQDFGNRDFRVPADVPCIVERLCNRHQGIVLEAKGIKEHHWKPFLKQLFEKKTLKGNEENLTGILDQGNFEQNCKSVNKEYEEYVLSVGDFDERIFLDDEAHVEIGTPAKSYTFAEVDEQQRMGLRRNLQEHFTRTRSLAPSTPLTGRRYLKEKDPKVTPVSTATQSVSRLQALLSGLKAGPSDRLLKIFSECSRNPQEAIESRVGTLGETFLREYVQPSPDRPKSPCSTREFATKRLKLAEILYFKVLESITLQEQNRLQGHLDLTSLLERENLHSSLMACCLEIIIFSYNSQRTFPWVIEIFDISPYCFLKIIEVFIKAEDGLSRDVVKHLNHIEEQILECLAWSHDSPLWSSIQQAGSVPSCEDVSLPYQTEAAHSTQNLLASPIIHPRVQRICGEEGAARRVLQLPSSPSAHDVFSSPITPSSGARRNLFSSSPSAQSAPPVTLSATTRQAAARNAPTLIITPAPGNQGGYIVNGVAQAVVLPNTSTTVQVTSPQAGSVLAPSNTMASPTSSPVRSSSAPTTPKSKAPTPSKPRKTGSLALFFRKLYHLSSVRLRDLCSKLDVQEDLRVKMWTCFEHTLMNMTELMKDRHIDQILMCSIYVMGKVTNADLSFQNIMKCYRTQPQAVSHVYRSVLLRGRRQVPLGSSGSEGGARGIKSEPGSSGPASPVQGCSSARASPVRSASTVPSTPPPTGASASGSSSTENSPNIDGERGDLIEFYNKVFIKRVKNFALKFSAGDRALDSPPLSPLPVMKNQAHSPRRKVSTRHPVYISPHKNGVSMTPTTRLLYCFKESPAEKLRDINQMLKQGTGETSHKRALLQDDHGTHLPAKISRSEEVLQRKLTSMIEERQASASR